MTETQYADVESIAPELGVFFLFTCGVFLFFMRNARGRYSYVEIFIAARPWPFLKNHESLVHYLGVLKFIIMNILCWPIYTLLCWTATLLYVEINYGDKYSTRLGISVFLICCWGMLTISSAANIAWQKYRINTKSIILFVIGFSCYIAFQFVVTFMRNTVLFFGLCSIFLAGNGIVIATMIYITNGFGGKSINDVIKQLSPGENIVYPEGILSASMLIENDKQRETLTQADIFDLFTLPKVDQGYSRSAVSGGVQALFTNRLLLERKKTVICTMYTISLCILAGLSVLTYYFTDDGQLGTVTSCAIISTDVMLFFYIYSNLSRGPFVASLMVVICRFWMVVLSGDDWYLGYCSLYIVYNFILFMHILNQRFPMIEQLVEQGKDKNRRHKVDLAKKPEFIVFISAVLFWAFTIGVASTDPKGVNLTEKDSDEGTVDIWLLGVGTCVFIILMMIVMTCFRLFWRKVKGVADRTVYYMILRTFDTYWLFISLLIVVTWLLGGLAYGFNGHETIIIISFFLPVIIALGLSSYLTWVMNDYSLILDIKEYNKKMKVRIQKEEDIIRRVTEYNKMYQDHMEAQGLPGQGNQLAGMTLSKNYLKAATLVPKPEDFKEEYVDEMSERPFSPDKFGMTQSKFGATQGQFNGTQGQFNATQGQFNATQGRFNASTGFNATQTKIKKMQTGLADIEDLSKGMPQTLPDWSENMSCCQALVKGKLLLSDYRLLLSSNIAVTLTVLMGVCDVLVNDDLTYGVSFSVMIFVIGLMCLPLIEYFATSKKLGPWEIISIFLGLVLNYGYGIIYYIFELDEDAENLNDGLNIAFMTFFLPMLISYTAGYYKWYKDKGKLSTFAIISLVLANICSSMFAIVLGLTQNWIWGGVTFAIIGTVGIYSVIIMKYVSNGFYLSISWRVFSAVVTFLICWIGVICAWSDDNYDKFLGVSVSYFTVVSFMGIYTAMLWLKIMKNNEKSPVFFSPWVFPIYKYDPVAERLVQFNKPGLLLYGTIMLTFVWSVVCVIWLEPVDAGVAVGSLCEVLLVLTTIYVSGISPIQLAQANRFVNIKDDPVGLKDAWLSAKEQYLVRKGAIYPDDIKNYALRMEKLDEVIKLGTAFRNGGVYELQTFETNIAWHDTKVKLDSLRTAYTEIYKEDRRATFQYLHELELIINFQLLIVIRALSSKSNEVLMLNNLVNAKKVELKAFGINIVIPDGVSTIEKYARAKVQIDKLDPMKRIRYESIKEQYQVELEEEKQLHLEREQAEKEASDLRAQKSKEIIQERKRLKQEQKTMVDVPIDEMIDSKKKYIKILDQFKINNQKFVDMQFPSNEKSLGPHCAINVASWKRAGDECTLFEGGVTIEDVKQGALGDCYFLSAITVLGNDKVQQLFVEYDATLRCGAYLVRFLNGEKNMYVIVDDFFPVNSSGEWAFVKTISGTELWPMIVEKAYAKLHGDYDSIAAGKVQFALADLTGGFPEEVKLETAQNNPDNLWKRMLKNKQLGYLMGAGSPENPRGDAAVSENGIVQGHAYAITNVLEIENERLIQLKNPHGQHGVEWNGDWSDGSFKWNKKFKADLKVEEKADGIFWMSVEDFVWEYKNLYICRLFDPAIWNIMPIIEGAWEGESAAGLPCKLNPQVKFGNNPQYMLTVLKPCTAFIILSQNETIDMFKGKLPVIFMIFSSKIRIKQPGTGMIGSSGSPIDLKTVSSEVIIDTPGSYVIVAASMLSGEKGHGTFTLKVITDDRQSKLVPLSN